LEAAERQAEEERPSEETDAGPCEAQPEGDDTQPQEKGTPASRACNSRVRPQQPNSR
jgi:hypothetical protein